MDCLEMQGTLHTLGGRGQARLRGPEEDAEKANLHSARIPRKDPRK